MILVLELLFAIRATRAAATLVTPGRVARRSSTSSKNCRVRSGVYPFCKNEAKKEFAGTALVEVVDPSGDVPPVDARRNYR